MKRERIKKKKFTGFFTIFFEMKIIKLATSRSSYFLARLPLVVAL